ncbi:uncharacterized protein TM35_000302120 [Trypanosoma theileri]|uniref:Uncharacterized protein n=1 Tax=Trypanosoma theileri TaxID=67003 RepID=A0A1X0NN70_9TRYP|nr:uncharacterized protein TM35_000302120 [Trypanosoma theileri]ORC86172.1 hypothetical protein TM35_000302120 [Trypanosoma theileri]
MAFFTFKLGFMVATSPRSFIIQCDGHLAQLGQKHRPRTGQLTRHSGKPSTATFLTDASVYGKVALLSKRAGEVLSADGVWEHSLRGMPQTVTRAVNLALWVFKTHLTGPWAFACVAQR